MTEYGSQYRFPETFQQFFSHGNHPLATDGKPIDDIFSSRDLIAKVLGGQATEQRQHNSILSLVRRSPLEDEAWHEAGLNVGSPNVHASVVAALFSVTQPQTMLGILREWRKKRSAEYNQHFPEGEFARMYQTMQNTLHPKVSAPWLPHLAPFVEPEAYVDLTASHFAYQPLPRALSSNQNARIIVEAEEAAATSESHELFTQVSDIQAAHQEHFQHTIYHQRTAIACQRGALAMRTMTNPQDILNYQPGNPFARDPSGDDMGITGFLKLIAYNQGRPPLFSEVRHPTPTLAAREAAAILHPSVERILGTFDRINERILAQGLANNVVTQLAIRGIIDYNLALLWPDAAVARNQLLSLRKKCVVHPDIQTKPPGGGGKALTANNLPPLRLPVE